jgi:3-phenylpropionate/cinnamic acid dioxygenase small subunit
MSATSSTAQDRVEVGIEEHFEVARFLAREAQLLDERRYAEWLTLLCEDIEYRVPIRRTRQAEGLDDDWEISKELSGKDELQMTVNRFSQLELRVSRLLSGKAHTENPPWFTQRLVTNIDVRHGDDGNRDCFEVDSKFLLNRFKAGREHTIVGSRKDTLRRIAGEFRISRRLVLYNADSYRWGSYVLI